MPMIMVVGLTGSGKSYFINQLVGREVVQEGQSMKSCTFGATHIPAQAARRMDPRVSNRNAQVPSRAS